MRIPSGKIPHKQLHHLWERHREIARRLVAGERPRDISRELGISEQRLSIITNSPAFRMYLEKLSEEADKSAANVQRRINELAIDSIAILEQAVRDKNDIISHPLKIKVAQDILNRAGYGAVNKTASLNISLTGDDIEELKRRRDLIKSMKEVEYARQA